MPEYVEAEALMVAWLKTALPGVRIATETPGDLADVLPCVVVSRFGGSEEEIYTFDNPLMDFDCFDATRGKARQLAYAVRTSIRRDLPGQTVTYTDDDGNTGTGAVSRTRGSSGPTWTPYDNTNVRRFVYTAQVRIHSI